MKKFFIPTLILLLFVFTPCFADTIHVPGDQPTIQAGIDAAMNGDTVLVAPGTYIENIDFVGKSITVISEQGATLTAIDGNQAGTVVTFENSEDENAGLKGFTITNGKASMGGGVYCNHASPTLIDNIIIGNEASSDGGGLSVWFDSPTMSRCVIDSNKGNRGGGIYTYKASLTLTDNIFIGNEASEYGGGIYTSYGMPTLSHCIFDSNVAVESGGGMYNRDSENIVANACEFKNNYAETAGGVRNFWAVGAFINCIFYANSCDYTPGGMGNYHSSPQVIHCTFAGNQQIAMDNEWFSSPTITNSIFWNEDTLEIWNDEHSFPDVTYCCVRDGYPGSGNFSINPHFVEPDVGDLHLIYNSPCMNTGDNTSIAADFDFEGDPRQSHGVVDRGADEFHARFYVTGDVSPGGEVKAKFLGLPDMEPVALFIGSGVLDPPYPSKWGNFYLDSPWIMIPMGVPIGSNGLLTIRTNIPAVPAAPYDVYLQALIGLWEGGLTNLFVLEVR